MPKLFWPLLIAAIGLLFELPVTAVIRRVGSMGPEWFEALSYFIHPAALLALVLLIFHDRHAPLGRERTIAIALLLTYGVGLILSGWINGSEFAHVAPLVILGPVLMSVLIYSVRTEETLITAAKALFFAGAAWSAVFLCLFAWDWSVLLDRYPHIQREGLMGVLRSARYPGESINYDGTYFYRYMGNNNKQSNILLLVSLVGGYLVARGRLTGPKYFLLCLPVYLLIIALGSRAAILVGAALCIALMLVEMRSIRLRVLAFTSLLFPLAAVALTPALRNAWLDPTTLVERAVIADAAFAGGGEAIPGGGTLVAAVITTDHSLAFGYGAGKFGPTIGRLPEAGSHIFFMDAWIEAGVLGLAALVVLFAWLAFRSGRQMLKAGFKDHSAIFAFSGISAVLILGLREYSFVYLFVQSTSAVLPALFMALALLPSTRSQ